MYNPTGFFITGTDTDIGKTYTARILATSMSSNRSISYMKPVQTGCTRDEAGNLTAPDYDTVTANGVKGNDSYERHVPYRFEPACSPHLAATLAGVTISLDYIRECYRAIAAGVDTVIVEGAGGILAPLGDTTFMIDLIVYLNLPAVVVTTPRLGTLNHTFLTLRVLRESGVHIAGVVMNCPVWEPYSFIYHDNLRMIKTHTHPTPFLELPFAVCDEGLIKEFCNAICNQL